MYGWRTTEKGLTKALALKLLFDTKPELESLASLSLDEINEKFIEAPDSKQALQDALSKYGYTYVIGIDGGEIVSIAQEEEKDEYYTDGFEEDDEFDDEDEFEDEEDFDEDFDEEDFDEGADI